MKVRFSLIYILMLIAIFGVITTTHASEIQTKDQQIEKLMQSYSLEQKVGQILLLGFAGKKYDKYIHQKIKKLNPGGMIFFKRNISTPYQASQLIAHIQNNAKKIHKTPIITAVDQEGGLVVRVKTSPRLPSALALGKVQNRKFINKLGDQMGLMLRAIGFNLNLAPVLDLSDPYKKSFIGNRSFGENPSEVSEVARLLSIGIQNRKVMSTAKHFPGHGDLQVDSHKALPISQLSKNELMNYHLVPYKKMIESNAISAVMMAHVAYPKIDPTSQPATFSEPLVSLLKNELSFPGLIITDDIIMGGAKNIGSIEDRAVTAFLAGNDMIMVAWGQEQQQRAYQGLLKAVNRGEITEERLDESVRKILSYKKKFGLFDDHKKIPNRVIAKTIKSRNYRKIIQNIHDDIINSEFKNHPSVKRDVRSAKNIYVFSSSRGFAKYFKKFFKQKSWVISIGRTKSLDIYNDRLSRESSLGVYYVGGPQTLRKLNQLPMSMKSQMIVVNTLYPGALEDPELFVGIINIPMNSYLTGKSLALWLNAQRARNYEYTQAQVMRRQLVK